jgi:UTP--glucose-1-phosphate uridylyltransferase
VTRVTRAVIPAAGLGTRFLPMTRSMPKEMLPVGRKPVIQYVIEEAVAAGITELLIVTGRGKRALEDYFDLTDPALESVESEQLDLMLDAINLFFVRQKQPRGLGDAIRYAEPFASGEPFVVLLGDTFTRPSCLPALLDAHARHGLSAVAVQHVGPDLLSRYGVVGGSRLGPESLRVKTLVEKPAPHEAPSDLAILGAYLLTPAIFSALDRTEPGRNGEVQLTDALRLIAEEDGLIACVSGCRRFDIGEPTSWILANIELGLADPQTGPAIRALLDELVFNATTGHSPATGADPASDDRPS